MAAPPALSFAKRWVKPEIYPLFAAMGVAVGLCGFVVVRNVVSHPDVRVNKEDRAAGYLENFDEGHAYKQHKLRKFLDGKRPQIFRRINKAFSEPDQ